MINEQMYRGVVTFKRSLNSASARYQSDITASGEVTGPDGNLENGRAAAQSRCKRVAFALSGRILYEFPCMVTNTGHCTAPLYFALTAAKCLFNTWNIPIPGSPALHGPSLAWPGPARLLAFLSPTPLAARTSCGPA